MKESSSAAKSSMPGRSTGRRERSPGAVAGRYSAPSTRQAADSGTLTVKTARQPPSPMSSPPSAGPTTETVWLATASAVSIPAGLSFPVRSASRRVSCMDAGYAAEVPKPSSTRAAISTPRDGESAPSSPAAPTVPVPRR